MKTSTKTQVGQGLAVISFIIIAIGAIIGATSIIDDARKKRPQVTFDYCAEYGKETSRVKAKHMGEPTYHGNQVIILTVEYE